MSKGLESNNQSQEYPNENLAENPIKIENSTSETQIVAGESKENEAKSDDEGEGEEEEKGDIKVEETKETISSKQQPKKKQDKTFENKNQPKNKQKDNKGNGFNSKFLERKYLKLF